MNKSRGFIAKIFGGVKHDPDEEEKEIEPKRPKNEYKITSFSYSYRNSFGDGTFTATVEKDENGISFIYEEPYGVFTYEPVPMEEACLQALEQLCADNKSERWDGYHKSNPDVLDGDGFSLDVKYETWKQSTSGSNCAPRGFWEFRDGMQAILNPYIEKAKEAARQEYLKREHSDKLDSFMMNFCNSDYPKDHEIFTRAYENDGSYFLDYRITLKNDNIYKAGEYRFSGKVEKDIVDFDRISDIIKRYNISKYNDTNEHEKGGEWYQINYSYDDGFRIGFSGSKPFENYEGFRKELLEMIFELVEKTSE